ncbi:MAG: hypothetical protein C3F13_18665 [Anaerolineales bacterium]|nr:hypothetical protein [Anaerolineae bacterium]PWB49427.1 MAG: hypothetical protein C3F13_18665 [Anaerolineales bacterium]
MQAPLTHFISAAAIQRERLMPASGRIVARRGQQVNPNDVVAEAMLRPEHLVLDIARGLGLSANDADHYIQRRAGDEVGEGDVIAGPVGLGRRVIRTPRSGTVVIAGGGQVLLELEGEFTELLAGYPGTVADIVGDRGVLIESTGSLLQGVWGNGRINYGLLNLLAHAPEDELTTGMMDVSLRGSVVMGAYCGDERVLQAGEELPIRGMILASMDSALCSIARGLSYPIVLLEGFGKLAMNPDAFNILVSGSRREAALIAEPWDRIRNTRPEVVISLPEGVRPEIPAESKPFASGQTVRVISPPYKSMVGTLTNLQAGLSVLPSGLRAETAGVRLANGDIVQIPLANLEVIK